jgi:O-methyltransferase involved in polyketide biosynthesis
VSPDDWRPVGVNLDQPSAARIYDYGLGGAHNFAIDREVAEQLFRAYPDARLVGVTNRAFLQRAVRHLVARGVRQFLDLGSGIPTVGNVHEIAHQVDPACRVVYVDNDPVAIAHTRDLLSTVDNAAMVDADLRDPEAVLAAPETRKLLDLDRPVALMMVAVLHYVPRDLDVAGLIRRYTSALAPGSYLAVSHTTADDQPPDSLLAVKKAFDETATPVIHRSRSEVVALFDGLDLVPPGVVWTPQWHPEGESDMLLANPARSATFCGLGRVTG